MAANLRTQDTMELANRLINK